MFSKPTPSANQRRNVRQRQIRRAVLLAEKRARVDSSIRNVYAHGARIERALKVDELQRFAVKLDELELVVLDGPGRGDVERAMLFLEHRLRNSLSSPTCGLLFPLGHD